MKFAVILTQGKQYRVEEGQELVLDRMEVKPEETVTFDQVLMVKDGEKVEIGQPVIAGASVKATAVKHELGEKVRVSTFKAKARVRKTIGFRHSHTVVKIDQIKVK